MKEELLKTLKYFTLSMLPKSWVIGFVLGMAIRHRLEYTNLFLYICIHVAMIFLFSSSADDMKMREIKGWYTFSCWVISLGLIVLSAFTYYYM